MTRNKVEIQPNNETEGHDQRTLIGKPPRDYWLHSSNPPRFDLTRPAPPNYPFPGGHESITLQTSTVPVIISPAKTALVIIDMQNFFLSPAIGRQADGSGNKAKKQLLDFALPAAAAAKMQVVWLNVGTKNIDEMPASTLRGFGFLRGSSKGDIETDPNELVKSRRLYRGLGSDLGPVTLEDGTIVQGGRSLMRDTWNADLPPDLKTSFEHGREADPPHVWTYKNRMSGVWHSSTPCAEFLKQKGISTLLFAGVNTDQCVGGTLQDAYSQGYDCILLSDACGTTSPEYTTQCIEYNVERSWGFLSDCQSFRNGVDTMLKHN